MAKGEEHLRYVRCRILNAPQMPREEDLVLACGTAWMRQNLMMLGLVGGDCAFGVHVGPQTSLSMSSPPPALPEMVPLLRLHDSAPL